MTDAAREDNHADTRIIPTLGQHADGCDCLMLAACKCGQDGATIADLAVYDRTTPDSSFALGMRDVSAKDDHASAVALLAVRIDWRLSALACVELAIR